MPLHSLVGLGQPNSAAAFFGGEVQLEDLFPQLVRYAQAFIANFGDDALFVTCSRDVQRTALRHRLHPVENYVQDGQLHKIEVDSHAERFGAELALDGNAVLLGIGPRLDDYIFQQPAKINFLEMQIAGSSEVHQNLDYSIQSMNLVVDNVHVAAGIGIDLLQLALQQLQMQHNRIDGIFHFMGYTARSAAACGHLPRQFNFILNAPYRLCVAQRQ